LVIDGPFQMLLLQTDWQICAAFAVPASAQPFSSVMGSWGYGRYERSIWCSGPSSWPPSSLASSGGCGTALAGTVEEWLEQPQADEQMRLLEALLRRAPSKARRIAV